MSMKEMLRGELNLTDGTCRNLEDLRLALEVMVGSRIRIKRLKLTKGFGSGEGAFFVGNEEHELMFIMSSGGETYFDLRIDGRWCVARFDSSTKVRISMPPNPEDSSWVWVVGTSATDRWEEPPHILSSVEG